MKAKLRALACSTVLLVSCGSHHDRDTTDNPSHKDPLDSNKKTNDGDKNPDAKKDPDKGKPDSFGLNSQEKFEQWKSRLVKSCNVASAFSDGPTLDLSVDSKVFLEKTKSSMLLKGKDGEFLIFSKPISLQGTEHSELVKSEGNSVFKAEFKRKASQCEVYIAGQKVYTTNLYSAIPVAAHWYKDKKTPEPTLAKTIPIYMPTMKDGFIFNQRFTQSIFDAMKADDKTFSFLSELLDISKTQSELFFYASILVNIQHLATLTEYPDILPFSDMSDRVYGPRSALDNLLKPNDFQLNLKIKAPHTGNTADNSIWVLNARVSVKPDKDQLLAYSASSIEFKDPVPFSDKDTEECMLRRTQFLRNMRTNWPSFGDAKGNCQVLSGDFLNTYLNSMALKDLLQQFLLQVKSSKEADYKDWDFLLKKLVERLTKENKNVENALDPEHKVPLIKTLSNTLENMSELLKSHSKLKENESVFTDTAVQWALHGDNVDRSRISLIMDSLEHSISVFPVSTLNLIEELGKKPFDFDKELEFAKNLQENYTSLAKQIWTESKDLGVQDWFKEPFSKVIQKMFSMDQLKKWLGTLNAADSFKDRETKRLQNKVGFDRKDDFAKVVKRALEEEWKDTEFESIEVIAEFAKTTMSCNYHSSVSSLVECKESDRYSKKKGLFLDPLFERRYDDLSKIFTAMLKDIGEKGPFLKSEMQNAFFKPIWNQCSNDEVKRKEKILREFVGLWKAANDWSEQNKIQTKIRDLMSECSL